MAAVMSAGRPLPPRTGILESLAGNLPGMLSLQLSEFMVELKEGSIKNVGPPNKTATAKIYDVVEAEAREFGDERVKIAVEDEEGNVVHVALDPAEASQVARDIEALEEDSRVFEED